MSLEAFVWSLALAAISGIMYIAYKHPKSFRTNIVFPLMFFAMMIVLSVFAYTVGSMGVSITRIIEEVSQLTDEKTRLEFAAVSLKEMFDLQMRVLGVGCVAVFYLLLLASLSKILGLEEGKAETKAETKDETNDRPL
jgi:hypothetical protein